MASRTVVANKGILRESRARRDMYNTKKVTERVIIHFLSLTSCCSFPVAYFTFTCIYICT